MCIFRFSKKHHLVCFLSLLNYGDIGSVLINHLHIVIPLSYPCHYTNLCPHKPHKPAHTHTHTHNTHTHTHHTHTTHHTPHTHTLSHSVWCVLGSCFSTECVSCGVCQAVDQLKSVSGSVNTMQQVLEEAARLLKLLWRVSLPSGDATHTQQVTWGFYLDKA